MSKIKRLLLGTFTALYCTTLIPVNAINIDTNKNKDNKNTYAEVKVNGMSIDEYSEQLDELQNNGEIDMNMVYDMLKNGDIFDEIAPMSESYSRAVGSTEDDDRQTIQNVAIPNHSVDGRIAFCLEVTKNSPYGVNYSDSGENTDAGLAAILYHGYPSNASGMVEKYGLTEKQARKYTQYAIWYYYTPSYFKYRSIPYINELLEHAKNKNGAQSIFNVSTSKPSTKEVNNIQESEVIKTSGSKGTFTFPSDSNVWSVDVNGNKKNTFNIGESFKIQAVGSVSGEIKRNITSKISVPVHELFLPSASNYQRLVVPNFTTKTVTNSKEVSLSFKGIIEKGSIEVKKLDENGNPLKDVTFAVYSDANAKNQIATAKTNSNGIATFSNLESKKTYYVKEISGLEGYVVDSTVKTVALNSKSASVTVTNTKIYGQIQITKYEANSKTKLQGAEFTIYDSNNKAIETIKTNENGVATSSELPYGTYTVKETKAPNGYISSNEVKTVKIEKLNEVYTLSYENNVVKGSIEVLKIDSDTKKPLEGVTFAIYTADDKFVEEITTNKDGKATSSNLRFGSYYIQETKALKGYVLDSTKYSFTIDTNNKVCSQTVTNSKATGKFTLTKIDSTTKKPMEGVEFKLEALSGSNKGLSWMLKTDSNGLIEVNNLVYGEYRITETKTLDGYILNTNAYNFAIEKNGQHVKYEMTNDRALGNIVINKVDAETKEVLEGVKFEVTAMSGLNKGKTWTVKTNKEGIAELNNLALGTYSIVETKTIDGYVLDSTPVEVTIEKNNETVTKEIVNSRSKGKVTLLKYDVETGEPLANVVFEIKGLNGLNEGKTWTLETGETGIIELDELHLGDYEISEIKTLDGYVLDTNPIPFSITENGQLIEKTMSNSRIAGRFEFVKYDSETLNPLSDVEFSVKGISGFATNIEFNFTTNKDGEFISEDLPYGTYEIIEVVAKEGYVLDSTPIVVEIVSNDVCVPVSMANKQIIGIVDFSKTDVTTGDVIPGAHIKIEGIDESNSNINFEFVSEAEGNRFTLPYGKYQITETIAPEGYVLTEEVGTFEILENGEIVEAELKNERIKGRLEIIKLSEEGNRKLQGAEFAIYNSEKEVIAELVTNEDGIAVLEDLVYGTYYFKETKAPFGYILDDTEYEFKVENHGDTIQVEFFNRAIPALPDGIEEEEPVKEPVQTIIPLPDTSGVSPIAVLAGSLALVVIGFGTLVIRRRTR